MPTSLPDPQGLELASRLELVARHAVEGFLSGLHPSPYFGSSVEYADHRPYSVGDEVRTIDWKLLAKTDKHYVKLYEEQTNTRCTIVLDISRSMAFRGGRAAMTKLEYGMHLAAALGYMMLHQHDAVGLALFDDEVRSYLPPRATARHYRQMLQTMQQATTGRDTRLGDALHHLAGRLPKRGILILISDLLDDPQAIVKGLAHFRHQRSEVIVFHLLDPDEREFPYDKPTRFRDIEGSGQLVTHPRAVKEAYLKRLDAFLDNIRRACMERKIGYEPAITGRPYSQMLAAYLAKRGRMQ